MTAPVRVEAGLVHQPSCTVAVAIDAASQTPERRSTVLAALFELSDAGGFDLRLVERDAAPITVRWADIDRAEVAGVATVRSAGASIVDVDVVIAPGLGADEAPVVLHELAHALGAEHSDNPDDVMYPSLRPGQARHLTVGDRQRVGELGRLAGCAPR